tara:strand:- start:437 stop:610 length:174 start_codon:yes stop_codon:yes gene_type:complete
MLVELIILIICLVGASWRAWQLGIREGASRTIDKLHKGRIIRFDHQGNIKPNEWFDS